MDFIVLIGAPILLLLGILTLMLFQLVLRKGLGIALVTNILVLGLVVFAVFFPTLGALFIAAECKIVVAPWWMQSLYDDRLLEYRSPPRFPVKHLKIARYTAVCPICAGSVTARWWMGVFRANHWSLRELSARARIFFDHVTRHGKCPR